MSPAGLETTVSVPGLGCSWRVGHEARIKDRKALSHICVGTGTEKKAQLFGQSRAPKATRQEIGAGLRGWRAGPRASAPTPLAEGFSVSGWSAELDAGGTQCGRRMTDPTSSLDSKERMAPVDIRHVYLHMYTCMCICEYDLTYYTHLLLV